MRIILFKLWKSSVFTSWISIGIRGLNTLLVLPLALSKFTQVEINLYLLFIVYFSIKDIFDLGFLNNTARFYTYTLNGIINYRNLKSNNFNSINFDLFNSLVNVSDKLYCYISIFFLLVMSIFGTLSIRNTLDSTGTLVIYYLWWIQVILTSYILYGNKYISTIIGFDKIDLLKKWDSLFVLFQVVFSLLILFLINNIYVLIFNNCFWYLLITLKNRNIAKNLIENIIFNKRNKKKLYEKYIYKTLFITSSQSFVAGIFGFGIDQFTRIFFGNYGNSSESSSYLLTMKVLDQIKQISRPPFYAKIPFLVRIASTKDNHHLFYSKFFKYSFWSISILIFAFMFLYFFNNQIVNFINSDVKFVSKKIMLLLFIALIVERLTALISQSIMIKRNKVISHIGLLISGIVYIIIMIFIFPKYGLISIPIALALSYLTFYFPYSLFFIINDIKNK